MLLNDDDIPTLIDAWRHAFGETLSPERAAAEAARLLRFYLLLVEGSSNTPETNGPSPTKTHELLSILPKIE